MCRLAFPKRLMKFPEKMSEPFNLPFYQKGFSHGGFLESFKTPFGNWLWFVSKVSSRGLFMTLSSIYDETFCEKI